AEKVAVKKRAKYVFTRGDLCSITRSLALTGAAGENLALVDGLRQKVLRLLTRFEQTYHLRQQRLLGKGVCVCRHALEISFPAGRKRRQYMINYQRSVTMFSRI